MCKLYFRYGVMGSSKTANLLMTKHNYEQKGFNVIVLKSRIDIRDMREATFLIRSRIGLSCDCEVFDRQMNIIDVVNDLLAKNEYSPDKTIIMVDEAQFCTEEQINQFKTLTNKYNVLCYGLLTDFTSHLFEGSKRLIELADSTQELKTVCSCGKKANINARISNGKVVTEGDQIQIGGDESYTSMCYDCWEQSKEV